LITWVDIVMSPKSHEIIVIKIEVSLNLL
jgi:hypothetical protein